MIKRYGLARMVVLASICITAGGCRIQSIDSYGSAVTPNAATPHAKGDPYMSGGIAEGSGGLKTKTKYQTDSAAESAAPPNAWNSDGKPPAAPGNASVGSAKPGR